MFFTPLDASNLYIQTLLMEIHLQEKLNCSKGAIYEDFTKSTCDCFHCRDRGISDE